MHNKTKAIYTYSVVIITGVIIAIPTYAMNGDGSGSGGRGGSGSGSGEGRGIGVNRQNNEQRYEVVTIDNKDSSVTEEQGSDGDTDIVVKSAADDVVEGVESGNASRQRVQNRAQAQVQAQEKIQEQARQLNGANGSSEGNRGNQNIKQNRSNNQYRNQALGTQVSEIARSQERLQGGIAEEVAALKEQGGLRKFFLGAKKEDTQEANAQLVEHRETIATLKELLPTTIDAEDKGILSAQIKSMEVINSNLSEEIKESTSGFNFLELMMKIFN